MYKIVFSKQADCDFDIIPLWYHWYTNIFKADKIIILATEVRGVSTINKILEFYKDKNIIIQKEICNNWHAPTIWNKQKSLVKLHLPKNNYLALSADSDEFFVFLT